MENTNIIIILSIQLIFAIFFIVTMWKIFAKAGQPGLCIFVPIYNIYLLLKIAGKPGWWLLLLLIPFVNFVIAILAVAGISRNFGNKSTWDKPFEEHFFKFIREINTAIFDNGRENRVYNSDVFALDIEVDLVYIDTPYIPKTGTLTHYRDFYHFLDGLSDYDSWHQEIDYSSKHKKLKSTYNIWEDKKSILQGFERLIEKFQQSILVISYRSDGIPTIQEISDILKSYGKKVRIESIDYQYVLSKKQNLKEVLIIGE